MSRFTQYVLLTVVVPCLFKITVLSQDDTNITALMSGLVTVTTKTGATFNGKISLSGGGDLQLLIESDGGEAILTFKRREIEALIFPGNSLANRAGGLVREGNLAEALPLLKALYKQKRNFLPYITETDLVLFTALPPAYLHTGQPADAIAVSRNLLPHLQDFQRRERLNEAILLGHFRLGLREETKVLAAEWIEKRNLYSDSALGWWIRAHLDFEEGNYREALWTSLHPIVFSGQLHMEYLDSSYALAIAACHELQKGAKAQRLYDEMLTRGLDWPEDERFAAYQTIYNQPSN